MSLRLWRRKQLFPGLRMNLSRSGVSLSVGRRGAWYTVGRQGRRVTVGAPGTGIWWTKLVPPRARPYAKPELVALALIIGLVLAANWLASGH
jgi:hypothetical protein